jgi:hypothetical protein
MTMDKAATATDRRSFLKSGAIVAAPLAVMAPGAAFAADDGSKAKLARFEDEKAIQALHRDLVREVNGGKRKLTKGLTALGDDPAHELQIAFAEDSRSATCRRACTAQFRTEFTGHSTLEQMHRLQGQGRHSHEESRELVVEYEKGKHGWIIQRVRLA